MQTTTYFVAGEASENEIVGAKAASVVTKRQSESEQVQPSRFVPLNLDSTYQNVGCIGLLKEALPLPRSRDLESLSHRA